MTPYKIYKKEIKRLIRESKIGGGLSITFSDSDQALDSNDDQARIIYNLSSGVVKFLYNSERVEIDPLISARHEFVHLLTANFECLANNRFVTSEQIEDESEFIARVLQNMII